MTEQDLLPQLLPGEHLLWWGAPQQGIMFTSRDIFLIPFSLLWGGFSIFWEYQVVRTGAPGFFDLWGIPFVLIGLYLIAGRFLADAWIRRSMIYGLTDRRILIVRGWPNSKTLAANIRQLPTAEFSQQSNSRGTIRFAPSASLFAQNRGFSSWTPSLDATPQFLGIEDAKSVFDKVQNLMAAKDQA